MKTTFLHGDLEKDIYMLLPQGFEVRGKENMVCKLQKSLLTFSKFLDSGTRIAS